MCMVPYSVGAKDRIKMHADTGTSKMLRAMLMTSRSMRVGMFL